MCINVALSTHIKIVLLVCGLLSNPIKRPDNNLHYLTTFLHVSGLEIAGTIPAEFMEQEEL